MVIRIDVKDGNSNPREPFLESWKEAVRVIGPAFFGPRTPETATNKNDLRPNWDRLDLEFGRFSHGEKRFTIAAISFFNSTWARELANRAGLGDTVCDLLGPIDFEWQCIIFRLAIHYRGW